MSLRSGTRCPLVGPRRRDRDGTRGPTAQCAAPDRGRTSPARTALSSKPLRSGRSRMGEKYVLDGRLSPPPTPSDSEAAMAAHDGKPILKMAGTICSLAKPDSVPRTTPPLCQDAGAGQGSACRPRPGQVRPQVRRRTGWGRQRDHFILVAANHL